MSIEQAESFLKEVRAHRVGDQYVSAVTAKNSNGEIISACAFNMKSQTNVFATIGTKTRTTPTFLYQAFETAWAFGVRRITVIVPDDNQKSIDFAKALGFSVEHRIFELWSPNKYAVMLSITRGQYYSGELFAKLKTHIDRVAVIEPEQAVEPVSTIHARVRGA